MRQLFRRLRDVMAQQTPQQDEASVRKRRSIMILADEAVPYNMHLPPIETVANSVRRSETEVVQRAIALAIVALKGETLDQEMTLGVIEQFGANGFFTPLERGFIDDLHPSDVDRTQFTWRYEAVHVLLWALQIYNGLGRPDRIANVAMMREALRQLGPAGLLERAELRDQATILDETDLMYRCHWAVVDARVNGRESPGGFEAGVVQERHYVFKWLVGSLGQDWDDISTDT